MFTQQQQQQQQQQDKKALLSQRLPRDAPNIWVPWKVSRVLANAPGYFSRNLYRVFVPIDTKNVHTKFEVRSFIRSWDNRRVLKKFPQSLYTPTLHFLPNFLRAFVRMDPLNTPAKFEVRSFTRSWDNSGYSKNWGSPWIRPCSLFSQIFHGLLFRWTLWMHLPTLKFIPVPEIIAIAVLGWGCEPRILRKRRP